MSSRPPKTAERLAAFLTPPACRQEVVGDLHERYRSPGQYVFEVLRTLPLVILSRIRRTADAHVVPIQAFALYASFLGAAWFGDRRLLMERWGLLRLAIPAGMALAGMLLEDAYSNPGHRSALKLIRGPVVGLGFALTSQAVLRADDPQLALPRLIALYGLSMSLLLSSAVRLLFPPVAAQLQGATAPALWLKQAGGSEPVPKWVMLLFKSAVVVLAAAGAGSWIGDYFAVPKPRVITFLLLMAIAYHLWKRE